MSAVHGCRVRSSFAARGLRVMAAAALVAVAGAAGCSDTKQEAGRDALTADVGRYPPGPAGANRPRVGVPPFLVTTQGSSSAAGGEAALEGLAADQMTTLLDQTDRFQVIERAQTDKLLNEQNLEGVVKAGELAKTGQVRGVDYLLLGKVTNLRVKAEHTDNGFGVGQITGQFLNAGGLDVKNKSTTLTAEAGVDIRLVDPTTGQMMFTSFSEYTRTDSANSMGVVLLGATADANADVSLSQDDQGKILRLALDDAVRKALPKVDRFLASAANKPTGDDAPAKPIQAVPVAGATPTTAPANVSPVVAQKFCPTCGKPMPPGTKFCPTDGTKID